MEVLTASYPRDPVVPSQKVDTAAKTILELLAKMLIHIDPHLLNTERERERDKKAERKKETHKDR